MLPDLPTEMIQLICKYIPIYELENIPSICKQLYDDRSILLQISGICKYLASKYAYKPRDWKNAHRDLYVYSVIPVKDCLAISNNIYLSIPVNTLIYPSMHVNMDC